MRPEVRKRLIAIAQDFITHLGLDEKLHVKDITISGSNAAYSYTDHSDIDLHLIVDFNELNDDSVYRELFDAKKTVYNESHDITINGYEVELYVQDENMPHYSLGEYSVAKDKWLSFPKKRRAHFDEKATHSKYNKILKLASAAIKSHSLEKVEMVLHKIKQYRKAGLAKHGEFGPENLCVKALRTQGVIQALFDIQQDMHSKKLSLNDLHECSGYIPSEAEKNDDRWKTALTVDIKPDTMQKNAAKLGSKIGRDGRPPLMR